MVELKEVVTDADEVAGGRCDLTVQRFAKREASQVELADGWAG